MNKVRELNSQLQGMRTAFRTLTNCARLLKLADSDELREKAELIERFAAGKPLPGAAHYFQKVRDLAETDDFWFKEIPLDHEYYDHFCRPTIEQLIWLLGDIDVLCSQATAANQHKLTFPEIVPDEAELTFTADEIWHPFVADAVANPVQLGSGRRFEVVSGPNMSGKSSHLKAADVVVLMAQMGGGVPGRGVKLSAFDQLFSNVNIVDSLSQGMSLFRNEEERSAQVIAAARDGRRLCFTADEIFRGTNALQGAAAGIATLEALVKSPATIGLLAVHDPDVTAWIETHPEFPWANMHFVVNQADGRLVYTHKLATGPATQFLAFEVLAEAGYPADVVDRARQIAAEISNSRRR